MALFPPGTHIFILFSFFSLLVWVTIDLVTKEENAWNSMGKKLRQNAVFCCGCDTFTLVYTKRALEFKVIILLESAEVVHALQKGVVQLQNMDIPKSRHDWKAKWDSLDDHGPATFRLKLPNRIVVRTKWKRGKMVLQTDFGLSRERKAGYK